jgi:hypothetical protein
MHARLRKSAALFSVVAVLGGGGIGAAQAVGASSSTAAPATARAGLPPHRGLSETALERIAAKLGVSATQLKAAVEANRPARRDGNDRPPAGAGPAAELAEALGVTEAKVQQILDANRPDAGSRDARPAKPDQSKLATALAAGLNLDKAKVEAALDKLAAARDKDHAARHAAEYAAIAKTLGVDADDVKAAFEAVLPARGTKA